MKQLNMMVDDEVKQAAVDGARSAGMLLNKWVSKAILERRVREIRGTDAGIGATGAGTGTGERVNG